VSKIEITKMSGAGNDFVVVDGPVLGALAERAEDWVRRICRRGLSVGADGVLFVGPAGRAGVRVEFRNPVGSPAFCANGTRCAARYARLRGMGGAEMLLETAAGPVPARVDGGEVTIDLPAPEDRGSQVVNVGGTPVEGRFVMAGVPHFVVHDGGDLPEDTLRAWGPTLRRASCFGPDGANVNLVRSARSDELHVRTWERGVEGETLSCGSGAVAAAFDHRFGGGPATVRVVPLSGVPLRVEFPPTLARPARVRLVGDARTIFSGRVDDEAVLGFPD
jgi:diaminopimelate epimerase